MNKVDKGKLAFYLAVGMQSCNGPFRDITLKHLHLWDNGSYKSFISKWRIFMRILFIHSIADPSTPVPWTTVSRLIGHKCNVTLYMMATHRWLECDKDKWHHTVITNRGIALVNEILKAAEQDYSTFFLESEENKK